ncbi:MAG TPA: isoprenylcysteine carboxylmethyltransferase family protein [Vicinamibacterales bacterium]|nr:isoprenylcysteine carboxylmethyltransferase family protein [Vicinamibacterales bacterium]
MVRTAEMAPRNGRLWARAIGYMCLFGGACFVGLPLILLWLAGAWPPAFRSREWLAGGGVLFLLGAALSWLAAYHLVTMGQGTPFPLDPTRALVTSGPYAHVRNPQAIATVLMAIGEIASLRSLALWWMLPLILAYLEFLAAPYEHRELLRRHGGEYLAYRNRVPRWIAF